MSTEKDRSRFQWMEEISSISRITPLFISWIYVAGFIVTHSHLGKRGLWDFSIANTQYLTAGALFFFFLVTWYLLAGRAIIFVLRWFDEEKERAIEHSFDPLWSLLIPVHVISRTAFFFCLSVNLFSFVLVQEYQSRGFPIVLLFLFAVDYAWTKLKRDDRWPRATQVVKSLIGITGVVAFQKTTPMSGPIGFVIIQFAIMSLIVNLVVESYARLEITRDKLIYDFLFAGVFTIMFASFFGLLQFETIKSQFGGGQPRPVTVVLKDGPTKAAIGKLGLAQTEQLEADLIHESATTSYLDIEGRIFRLHSDAIAVIEVLPRRDAPANSVSVDSVSGLGKSMKGPVP